MKNMPKNKVAIGIGIVLLLGILVWIGWKYWGSSDTRVLANGMAGSQVRKSNISNQYMQINKGGVYDVNGNPIKAGGKTSSSNQRGISDCQKECNIQGGTASMQPYPHGSQYYGYYWCACRMN